MTCLLVSAHFAYGAPASESYILDSISIGRLGTNQSTSTSYQTDSFGSLFFFQGESIVTIDDDDTDVQRGSGSRITVQPLETRSHIYTEVSPLVLKNMQSGTLYQSFTEAPHITEATLYISPYAAAEKESSTLHTTYTLERYTLNDAEKGIFGANVLSDVRYKVAGETEGRPITLLRKFLTLIIRDDALRDVEKNTYTVYYLHPTFHTWVRMPHPAFIEGAVIFQTPYVTHYLILKGEGLSSLIQTEKTPTDISLEEIQKHIDADTEHVTQTEIQERGMALPTIEPSEPSDTSLADTKTFFDTIQKAFTSWYAKNRTLLFLLTPFILLGIACIPMLARRWRKTDTE